jgi:lysophospholipase L1-like esterase
MNYVDLSINHNNFAEAFRYIMEGLIRSNPLAHIFCALPIQNAYTGIISLMENIRDVERKICSRLSIPVIETGSEDGITCYTTNWNTYMSDELHPNDAGYNRIKEVVKAKLLPYCV